MAATGFTGCFFFHFYSFSFCATLTYVIFILIKILCLLEWLPIWYLCCARQADPAHMFNASNHFHFSVPVWLFLFFGGDYFWPGSFYIFNSWYWSLTLIGGGTCAASARAFLWVTFTGSGFLDAWLNHRHRRIHFAPIGVTKAFFFVSISMATKRPFAQNTMQQIYWMQPWLPMGERGKSDYVPPELIFTFSFSSKLL